MCFYCQDGYSGPFFNVSGEYITEDEAMVMVQRVDDLVLRTTTVTTPVGTIGILTLFNVIDMGHDVNDANPLLWTTITLNGPTHGEGRQYHTRDEALIGHDEIASFVRAMLDVAGVSIVSEVDGSGPAAA